MKKKEFDEKFVITSPYDDSEGWETMALPPEVKSFLLTSLQEAWEMGKAQSNQELVEKVCVILKEKYEKSSKEKPFVHRMLNQTAREAYERRQGFLSGLLVSIKALEDVKKLIVNK